MPTKITIDPMTRIEGHLTIEATVDDGVVKEARSSGTLFRGFEILLQGREPGDAPRITQRVCGICPTAHATASTLSLESAFGIADQIPDNGRIMRNLIAGANFVQSHILHFYHLTVLDYADITVMADYEGKDAKMNSLKGFVTRGELGLFVPPRLGDYRLGKATSQEFVRHYLIALEMQRLAQEMLAIFGGKMPHECAVVLGGVTERPTIDKITGFLWRLNKIRDFVNAAYVPDVVTLVRAYADYFQIGAGPGNYLSYGAFELEGQNPDYARRERLHAQGALERMEILHELDTDSITESVKHSWFAGDGPMHPTVQETKPNRRKEEAYSWIKSPRYAGKVYEVGPLARMLVSYHAGREPMRDAVDGLLTELQVAPAVLNSVLGRHIARALETKLVADRMAAWVLELKPGEPVCVPYGAPQEAAGMGIVDAPRGALGHWVQIENGKIGRYQLVVPTTWNASPKDERGQPGPIEQSLIGARVQDPESPHELARIVRSFDPCLACAVHMVNAKGRPVGAWKVG